MDEVRKEAAAQKESESEGSGEGEEAQKDPMMAEAGKFVPDTASNGKDAAFDHRDKSASQRGAPPGRQKYTGRPQRKMSLR